jgi:hypothetical protein
LSYRCGGIVRHLPTSLGAACSPFHDAQGRWMPEMPDGLLIENLLLLGAGQMPPNSCSEAKEFSTKWKRSFF